LAQGVCQRYAMRFAVLALHGLSLADRGPPAHVLKDVAHSEPDATADFEAWCADAVPLLQGKVATEAEAFNASGASVAKAAQEMQAIDAEYAKLRREALPQPGQSGLDAAMGAMVRSASPEQQILHQSKVSAGITQSRVQTAYHDAKVLGGLLGGLLRAVNKACFQARNFDAEVEAELRPTPPPFALSSSSRSGKLRVQSAALLARGERALRREDPAPDPQSVAVDVLVARRAALQSQDEQCRALRAGAETISAARAAAAETVARAKDQKAKRAEASEDLKASFEGLAAELADLQAAADRVFTAELQRYSELATAAARDPEVEAATAVATEEAKAAFQKLSQEVIAPAEGPKAAPEVTALVAARAAAPAGGAAAADAGHKLWVGWRTAIDKGFVNLRKFLQLRHGQLVSTAEGHKETARPPHTGFRKTEPPDGAHCRSAEELQAELDKLDAQIDEVTATSFA